MTDNGSNFVKAFKEFGVPYTFCEEEFEEGAEGEVTVEDENENENIFEDNLVFTEIDFDVINETDQLPVLSTLIRCCAHTLSLIATTDASKALSDKTFIRINHSTMAVLTALWNSSNRPKSAEIVKKHLNCFLKRPVPTRWNSLFDSLELCIKHLDKINRLLENLNIRKLTEAEKQFLEEYVQVLRPIAESLDHLQSQNNFYYAALLPTLFTTKNKLELIPGNDLQFCLPLLIEVKSGFEKRFSNFLELKDNMSLLPAITHPFYKMRWLPPYLRTEQLHNKIISLLLAHVEQNYNQHNINKISSESDACANTETSFSSCKSAFYLFEKDDIEFECGITNQKFIKLQIETFLTEKSTNLNVLENYPAVKKYFL